MVWYVVYEGRQRYKDGSVRRRVRVRELRGIPDTSRPRIISEHYEAGDLWVTVVYRKRVRVRGNHVAERPFRRDIHLGKGVRGSARLTRHPPKGPRINRK